MNSQQDVINGLMTELDDALDNIFSLGNNKTIAL